MSLIYQKQAAGLGNLSETGQRKVMTVWRRIRRKAKGLGFLARRDRRDGQWRLLTQRHGTVVAGPMWDLQFEQLLDRMAKRSK
jgi:hypothetical protein